MFTFVAALTDLLQHKIYNWTTYPGMIAGFAVNLVEGGQTGLEDSLTGFFLCGLIMLVCFALFGIGGGDVKLIAMMAAFLGFERGLEVLLWTFVIGAMAGLIALIWSVGFFKLTIGALRYLMLSLRLGKWQPLSTEERQRLEPRLYLAPAAACAVVIVVFQLVK